MAAVRFTKLGTTPSGASVFSAELGQLGPRPQLSSAEMLVPQPLRKDYRLSGGTDRNAPR